MPSTRAFAIAAALSGLTAATAGVGLLLIYLFLSALGHFDSPADDTPLTVSFGIGASIGFAFVVLSRFWSKERRTVMSGILFGAGAGMIADAVGYLWLQGH